MRGRPRSQPTPTQLARAEYVAHVLRILGALSSETALSVPELATHLGVPQRAVYRALEYLDGAGVRFDVSEHYHQRYYRLAPEELSRLFGPPLAGRTVPAPGLTYAVLTRGEERKRHVWAP